MALVARGKHPVANMVRVVAGLGLPALENGRELPGDRKLQGDAGLRVLDPERQPCHVDALPAQGQHLLPAHAGVKPEPQGVPDRRIVDLFLDPGAPTRQDFCRGRDLAPRLAVELATAGNPEIDRIAQSVPIDTRPTIDRSQQRDGPVGRRPAMVRRDAVEPNLDIPAGNGVESAREPVAQVAVRLVAVELVGPLRTIGIDRHVLFEGLAEGGHRARFGALIGGVGAAGDLAEQVLGQLPGLLDGDLAVAAYHDSLVGGLPPAVAGAVVDEEDLGPRWLDANAEAGQLVVPGDPGLVAWLERLDGPLGECRAHPGDTFSGFL